MALADNSLDNSRKMKYACRYPFCTSKYYANEKNKHMYSFPRDENLRLQWKKACGFDLRISCSNFRICEDHFREKDFVNASRHLLNHNTVPLSFNDPDDPISDDTGKMTDADLEHVLEGLPIPLKSEKSKVIEKETSHQTDNEDEESCEESAVCRLCLSDEAVDRNIFEDFEGTAISDIIICCIPDIKISDSDHLSKWVCQKCLDLLKGFYKFRETCLKMDQKQRELPKHTKKRKNVENYVANVKKLCSNANTDNASNESESDMKVKSDLDKKFDQVEAELMKALEGKLPEEMRSADNIIIEVQSDDESEETDMTEEVNVLRVGSDEVKLPKGIKVSVNQTKTGLCEAQDVGAFCSTEFCLIDNYVFEYRLCKGNIRYLRCLVTKCKSIGCQTMIEPGVFENKVLVKVAHNHPVPSEDERKKQIFLHLMRRKMQTDKTLNFRSVYEEFCEKDPEIKRLVPLKTVINQICCQQMNSKPPPIYSFEQFFELIENDEFQKLHFTHSNSQFYQEKFAAADGSKAVLFANCDTIERISDGKIMYVDASFRIDTLEHFKYHLVSVLVWITDSYYPILFALINEKSQELYKLIFSYLHDTLAPKLRPEEIVTDYEASLYYSLGEVYMDSHIGGSVFYYTQNIYKKICALNLSRELETNSCFRNIYHMILMLPLLPVNTILDGLNNIELQATEMGQSELVTPIFEYVKTEWIGKVTPDLFCVHRLENRINENVIAPFKKLRDFIMLSKGKMHKQQINIVSVVEKLIELEAFLTVVYSAPTKKSFARDLSSSQKKNVIRAWHFIESHPKININNFFTKVLGYLKCMENQLWIWGFYRYAGDANDELINAANFSIVNSNEDEEDDQGYEQQHQYVDYVYPQDEVVVDVVIDQKNGFLVKEAQTQDQRDEEAAQSLQDLYGK